MTLEEERAANRAAMPDTADAIDLFTRLFGKPAWFRLTENGRTVEWGKRTVPEAPQ